ncbi:unnamed protein product [Hymenolepis diminuta]|uniref:Serine/threonine-protein kinase ULK3 n=2 Tax=Hymenolepis diminuta TaxID=6216 RepID=A0A564YIP8_HYMDI|nr:unnamed protein product [Hymenolepis diminuta]
MLNVFGYVFTDLLGRGTYGEVFKAINQKSRSIYAVKRISKKSLCKKAQDNLVEEIGILKKLHHRNIVSMMDFTWDSEYVYIFMEYLGGGDLSSFLKTEKRLSERTIRYFLQQLAFALHYLYERNIVHMDIKPQNILLTASTPPILKLADFGFAKSMRETVKMNEVRGSLLYLAPEIYKYGVYDKSCDLWSVGIILYQCLFGKTPFHCNSKEGVKAKLLEDTPISIPDRSTYSTDCIDLLSKLLKRRPSERINHDQFFIHPFIDLSHAPCPLSIYKAVKHITLGDELLEKGNVFDAYVNYKEGLTHLVFALQVESDPSRRKIMRSKLSHYIKVAEELSDRLNDSDLESQEYVTIMSDAVKFKTKGSSLPARPKRPPSPAEAALKGQDTRFSSSSSIPPSSSLTDTKSAETGTSVKSGQVLSRASNRGGGLLSNWFGCLSRSTVTPGEENGNTLSSPRLPSSSHLPHYDRPPSASSESASSLSATESVSQPPVKTAFEYAFDRIEALKSISAAGSPQLLKLAENLQHYYFLLSNNQYKSAMQYIQHNFGDWIGVAKGVENAEISKSFRSELNEALTSAEKLKAALKVSEQMSSIPEEAQSYQSCTIS